MIRTVLFEILLFCAVYAQGSDVLAVFDLQNQGGVSADDIDQLCDAIAEQAMKDSRYFIFDRALIGQVLEETGVQKINNCSHQQCLATLSNLVAAQKAIGGSIQCKKKTVTIKLILVDVSSAEVQNSVTIEKQTSRENMLSIHIPKAVTTLLTGKSTYPSPEHLARSKRKRRWWIPVTGILTLGGAGVIYYLETTNEKNESSSGSDAIPMDDLPVRTRE